MIKSCGYDAVTLQNLRTVHTTTSVKHQIFYRIKTPTISGDWLRKTVVAGRLIHVYRHAVRFPIAIV
jgi:hypothetical protein